MATVQEFCAALLTFHSTDTNNDVDQISLNQAFVCVSLYAYFCRILLDIDVFISSKIPRENLNYNQTTSVSNMTLETDV